MKILVTGGAGFIGANTAAHFLKKGNSVTVYDNLYRKGVQKNIEWLKKNFDKDKLSVKIADVRDYGKIKNALQKADVVFHFAGQTAVTTSINKPREDFEMNALGTLNILEAMREVKPNAIMVYSSTNKVYGGLSRVRTVTRGNRYIAINTQSIDETEPLDFYSPYGVSKGTGDQYTLDYARTYGLRTIVFRQSCIYGTHQFGVEDQGWVAHFAACAIRGKPITIFGNGRQVRDILFIDDLIEAFEKALRKITTTRGEVYNIGGGIGNAVSLLELIEILEKLTDKNIKVNFGKERQGDQRYYVSNIKKASYDFQWKPKTTVEQGISILYQWLAESLK